MNSYQYKAIDDAGRIHNGQTQASNVEDLEMRLRRLGLDLVNYKKARSPGQNIAGRSVNRRDLLLFCFHLEQSYRAGVPVLESLQDLRDSMDNPQLKEVIAAMRESIEGGKTLSQAMKDFPGVFTAVFANLVQTGEQTGELAMVLARLGENLKWQDEIASQTRKLIAYPVFVGTVVASVIFFLMTYIMPELLHFVNTMGQELPAHTRALMLVSDFFVNYWHVLILLPVLVFAVLLIGMRLSPDVSLKVDTVKIHVPVLGVIVKKIILARLASFFAMMYAAGITIIDCIETAEDIAGNRAVGQAMSNVGREIASGKSLSASFASTGLFPPLVLRMIKVGETTGALQESLENVAYFYTRDVRESVERLQAMIEPTMTVVLGLVIGWVVFSVLGPIYDLIAGVRL